jgi:hypothetical protein
MGIWCIKYHVYVHICHILSQSSESRHVFHMHIKLSLFVKLHKYITFANHLLVSSVVCMTKHFYEPRGLLYIIVSKCNVISIQGTFPSKEVCIQNI